MKPVDLFHIGPQKAATTWIYRCLHEHSQVACPPKDTIHYFDMHYAKGRVWYESFFKDAKPSQKLFDPTPSYIRSTLTPKRIYQENSGARIAISMRNPIERAFSHYWHEKKKRKIKFTFKEALSNYDLFNSWIEPGFYAEHIERYLNYFPKEQILCQLFDDIKKDPNKFFVELCRFYKINDTLTPSVLHTPQNVAQPSQTLLGKTEWIIKGIERRTPARLRFFWVPPRILVGRYNKAVNFETLSDIDRDVLKALQEICNPEIERTEKLLDIDLSYWKKYD